VAGGASSGVRGEAAPSSRRGSSDDIQSVTGDANRWKISMHSEVGGEDLDGVLQGRGGSQTTDQRRGGTPVAGDQAGGGGGVKGETLGAGGRVLGYPRSGRLPSGERRAGIWTYGAKLGPGKGIWGNFLSYNTTRTFISR
jgi:hypothetical protein